MTVKAIERDAQRLFTEFFTSLFLDYHHRPRKVK